MTHGIICAAQPESTEAGAEMLKAGGNAVDAAIACALVAGVVDPLMCGIAGFGSLQLKRAGEAPICIDFHGKAPMATTPDMWADRIEGETRDGFGFILRDRVNDVGYQSITAPGSLKAYHEAQSEYGVLPWADVVQPAIDYAEKGFLIRPHVDFWFNLDDGSGRVPPVDRLRFTESGRRIYFHGDGALKKAGDWMNNPDLANTLRIIAREGAETLYTGRLAEKIDADMRAHGALLTGEDLAAYQTVHTKPLEGRYRDWDITTNRPPGGGLMLLEMLNMLENFDLSGMGHNTYEYVRTVCEVMMRATSDKDNFIGDPAFVDVPISRLADKDYARQLAEAIKAGERGSVERVERAPEAADTTHVSVLDEHGNAVTMTHSLGMPSGVITDGLGFMYNGCMGVFDPRPGRADSLAPGKGRFSSMCPSILYRDGEPKLILGAPGGTQIAMGVLHAILNVVDFGMTAVEAVSAPRFSATSSAIDVSNRIPRFIQRALEEDGYEVIRSHLGFGFAAVHAILVDPAKGWTGGADPGHDGIAIAV